MEKKESAKRKIFGSGGIGVHSHLYYSVVVKP
jgi:hypothetical protein